MDIIEACAVMIPVAHLATVVAGFKLLLDSIQRARWSQTQLRALATSVGHLLQSLDGEISANRLSAPKISREIKILQALITEINAFVQQEEGRGFLNILFNKDDRIAAIELYHQRLCSCASAFQISALIDIHDWQKRNDEGRDADRQILDSRLTELENNQMELKEVLDIHHNNMVAMMTSLQRFVTKRLCGDREHRFFSSTLNYLAEVSGHHVVDIEGWMVTPFDVEFGPKIGSGGFGEVFKGTWNRTQVALKVLKTESGAIPSSGLIRQEIKTWSTLLHPHILQFLGANIFDDRPFIVMPFFKNGNARDYVRDHPACNRTMILHHISLGLVYLHHNDVMHGDLKALNVLIDDAGRAVLCDFGLSQIKSDASTRSIQGIASVVGSRNWMSPERMTGGALRKPVDMYAFGMTTYEILTGQVPLGHIEYIDFVLLVVKMDVRPERPEDCPPFTISDDLWSLAEACWAKVPQDRPTALRACDRIASILADAPRLSESRSSAVGALSLSISAETSSDLDAPRPSLASPVTNSPSALDSASVAEVNGGVGDEGPSTGRISRVEVSGDSSHTTTSDGSRRPTETESTRPTTAGSGSREIAPKKAQERQSRSPDPIHARLDAPLQNDNVTSEPGSMGISDSGNQVPPPPPSPTDVHKQRLAGKARSTAQDSSVGSPTSTRPPTGDSTFSRETRRSSGYSTDSVAGNDSGVAGPSSGNTSSNAPRPSSVVSGASTAGKRVTDNQNRLGRVTSWLASKTRGRHLSPVRETSGFRISDCPIPNVRSLSTEMWSLEDLLDRWIRRSLDIHKDEEFQDIFLMTYTVFTTCSEIFSGLRCRFEDAALNEEPAQTRALMRYSIISAVKYWVTGPYTPIDPDVPAQMKAFANSVTSSAFLGEKAKEIADIIDSKTDDYPLLCSSDFPTTVNVLLDNTPEQIAASLTMLEALMYSRIRPADYINHLQAPHVTNRVDDAFDTTRKITFWIKQKVLRSDHIKTRGKAFKFFLKTAESCYEMRNFSSTAAIITALESDIVQCLTETLEELDGEDHKLLKRLNDTVHSESTYRTALSSSDDSCVPCLEYHLHDLKQILPNCLPTVGIMSVAPINIMGCIALAAQMREITKFKTPPTRDVPKPERLGYLLKQLTSIEVNNEQLRTRSQVMKTQEVKFRKSGTRALEKGGFL